MHKVLVIALLLALPAQQVLAADSDAMARAANGFYTAYSSFHPSDGIPDAAARAKYAPYVSPGLDALLIQGGAAEDGFAAANKNAPPLIEGDLFTSNFEGATAFKVGACTGDAVSGRCAIDLAYDPGRAGNPNGKPLHWTDIAYMTNGTQGWRVDDIGYGGSWDFGNKGRMSETLRMMIKAAGN